MTAPEILALWFLAGCIVAIPACLFFKASQSGRERQRDCLPDIGSHEDRVGRGCDPFFHEDASA